MADEEQVRKLVERSGIQDAEPVAPMPRPPRDAEGAEDGAGEAERHRVLDYPAAFEEYEKEERRGDAGALHLGWPSIDRGLGKPIRPGEVVIVGARTGVGKTWIAQHAVERKLETDDTIGAVNFTMEMSAYQMAERFAGRALGLSTRELTNRIVMREPGVSVETVLASASYLHRLRFFESATSIETIPEVIDIAEQDLGLPVGLIVVDYAQLLAWRGSNRLSQTERVTENARRLKELTRGRRVITIACAQLTRAGGGGTTEPSMEWIRESGAIEEASDRILLAWRIALEKDEDTGKPLPGQHHEIWVKVEKNRHGMSGQSAVIRYDHSMRMDEVDELALQGQDELLDDDAPLERAPEGYGGDDVPF